MPGLIKPHGGELRNLYLEPDAARQAREDALALPSWVLSPRQLCDVELILNGAFSPLGGFLSEPDYDRVVEEMRLAGGALWPMPVNLDVSREFAAQVTAGDSIALRDRRGSLIAVMEVGDNWTPDKAREARKVFGTEDKAHPAVRYLEEVAGSAYLGGRLRGVEPPLHSDFRQLRDSPAELRSRFAKLGWRRVVAFHTRSPMHRAHQELTFRAARQSEANLLIHAVAGMTAPGETDHFTRVRCYEKLLKRYPEQTSALSLLALGTRVGGPREAVWHAIIRKNFGCSHIVIGHDHAGPGKDAQGRDFYGPYDAQQMVLGFEDELEIGIMPMKMMVYVRDRAQYVAVDEVSKGEEVLSVSDSEFRRRLQEGLGIPDWFSYPDIIEELKTAHPPRHKQGFAILFSGPPGSGRAATAGAVRDKLLELGGRRVSLLGGEREPGWWGEVPGITAEHGDLSITSIGLIARAVTQHGGVAICAALDSDDRMLSAIEHAIGEAGCVEVSLSAAPGRSGKRGGDGVRAGAGARDVGDSAGTGGACERARTPALRLEPTDMGVDNAAHRVILKLESLGYVR